jgi:hypothetical protein
MKRRRIQDEEAGNSMRRRPSVSGVVPVALVCLVFTGLAAYGEEGADSAKMMPVTGPCDLGVIFNTSSLLLELESYQAGLGAKIGLGRLGLRGSFGLGINGSASSLDLGAGVAAEYHLTPQPVSFYAGGSLDAGYVRQSGLLWSVPLTVAVLAGVEVFPFEFLSLFAEYKIAFSFSATTLFSTSQTTFDYLLQTGIGNGARIGLVLYFMRGPRGQ